MRAVSVHCRRILLLFANYSQRWLLLLLFFLCMWWLLWSSLLCGKRQKERKRKKRVIQKIIMFGGMCVCACRRFCYYDAEKCSTWVPLPWQTIYTYIFQLSSVYIRYLNHLCCFVRDFSLWFWYKNWIIYLVGWW